MRKIVFTFLVLSCFLGIATPPAFTQTVKEPRIKPEWTADYQPFRIAGNLYYVGTQDLACYLITTPKGHILINTGCAGSDTLIALHLTALGFKMKDIKVLLTMQAHYDHMGAMATIKAQTGAKLMIDAGDAAVATSGGAKDYEMGKYGMSFQPV